MGRTIYSVTGSVQAGKEPVRSFGEDRSYDGIFFQGEGRGVRYVHLPPSHLYRLSVLPLPYTIRPRAVNYWKSPFRLASECNLGRLKSGLVVSLECNQSVKMEESMKHARSYAHCTRLLNATLSACCTDNSLFWMPVRVVTTCALCCSRG